mgnify:CR=1 FL=1
MIHYNMRYRGPYEYEKFLLNVLQYSNMSHDFSSEVNEIEEYETLKELQDTVTDLFNKSTGAYGTSEQCYKKLIMFKEVK